MKGFDVYKFLYNDLLKEQGEEETSQQNDQQQPEEPSAQQNQKVINPVSSPFDQFTGSTIKNMKFKPHENGGSITFETSLSPVPVVISWVGDRVTLKYKDVIPLS